MVRISFNHVTNEHDKELIRQANMYDWTNYYLIDENAAETEEARQILHDIYMINYREEEAACGCD